MKGEKLIKVWFDSEGNAVSVKNKQNKKLEDMDYNPSEKRRIEDVAVLATNNWCQWRLVHGVWKCFPI